MSGIVKREFLNKKHRMENVNSLSPNLNLLRMLLGKFQVSMGLVYARTKQGAFSGVSL